MKQERTSVDRQLVVLTQSHAHKHEDTVKFDASTADT